MAIAIKGMDETQVLKIVQNIISGITVVWS